MILLQCEVLVFDCLCPASSDKSKATFVDSAHLHIALMQKAGNADPTDPDLRTWISDSDESRGIYLESHAFG